ADGGQANDPRGHARAGLAAARLRRAAPPGPPSPPARARGRGPCDPARGRSPGQGAPRGRSRESLISPEPGSTRIIASRPAGGAFTLPLREKLGGTEVLRAHPSRTVPSAPWVHPRP